jgi:ribonuclease VapC
MIVVDSSALVAIFEAEPDALRFARAIRSADRLPISAFNVHETGVVMRARHGPDAVARVWSFLREENDFEIAPFDEQQARAALVAFGLFGKGVHPARLDLADCAAYALAKTRGCPLFFKGDDFPLTDIRPAIA